MVRKDLPEARSGFQSKLQVSIDSPLSLSYNRIGVTYVTLNRCYSNYHSR